MKLATTNTLSINKAGRLRDNLNAKHNLSPILKKNNDNIGFTGDFTKTIDKAARKITYSNMGEVAAKIDGVLGDGFFTKTVRNAGLSIDGGKLQLPNEGIFHDLLATLKYPIADMPRDILNATASWLQKFNLTSGIGKSIASWGFLKSRAAQSAIEKNTEIVSEIMECFANPKTGKKLEGALGYNIEECLASFKNQAASNVAKLAKNYKSRDERTLNRMATATVSALYGAWDFHNISMLQKDDNKAAKKAGRGRFRQEITRMLFNAGTTFITLGALNKYIKNSMAASVGAIAASALLAEVGSRIIHKKPLYPLSPKEAEKIALKQHPELAESLNVSNNNKADNKVNFKQKLEDTNKIFVQFQSKDGHSPAIKCLKNNVSADNQPKKKKLDIKKVILGAFGIASVAYLISSALKGEFTYKNGVKKLFKDNNGILPKDEMKRLIASRNERTDKFDIFKPIKKFLTTKKQTIDLAKLKDGLTQLKATPNGAKIEGVIDDYADRINALIGSNSGKDFVVKQPVAIREGLYNGFSRLFDNVYTVLSTPGRLLSAVIDKFYYGKSFEAAEVFEAKMLKKVKMDKVVPALNKIISNAKDKNAAAQEIAKLVRNFDSTPETGKLASLARTLVTAISTYFFVNDYTNSVLIESAGKDIQGAKEERNERIAHKGANFVINGTLMNLFNSIFVKPLNNSLIGATLVATATETTNELLVRKSICQPVLPKGSKQEIIDFEEKQLSKKGVMGAWTRIFKKVTGKKSLTQKANIDNKKVG